jgi:ribose transport system ATP-binding protein
MGASAQSVTAGPRESPPVGDILLCAKNIKKVYGGAVALADGNLTVRSGEIHALLGENGAGKSTLIKCLAGTPPPDAGEIQVGGTTLPLGHSARHSTEAGLAFIHQETTLIDTLSVDENIALANGYQRRGGLIDWRQVRRSAQAAMEKMGVNLDPSRLVAELPGATRTVLAIAAALARSAKILVLDEPTASLGADDVKVLFGVLRRISEAGNAVVFVSHRLDEVYELCDRITILRDGVTVGVGNPSDISKDDLIALICGRHVAISKKQEPSATTAPALAASDLRGPIAGPVSFTVQSGDIIGFTGLSDAGHYELGEILFGLKRPRSGGVTLFDRPFAPNSPIDAMRRGVGYVPPDRNVLGLARDMSLSENLFFNPRHGSPAVNRLGMLSNARERTNAGTILRRFGVRPPFPDERIVSLSGGNAQKVLVARWLFDASPVLIVNDISVGVDVSSREEIYEAIRREASRGAAVLVITSDFEEIEALCSRAFVFVRGVCKAELTGAEVNVPGIAACLVNRTPSTETANVRQGVQGGDLSE